MSRILITGTSGFIGGSLAAALADQHEVIGLSRKPTSVEGVTAVEGDFANPNELKKLEALGDIDMLIHLAAVTGRGPEHACMDVNVTGSYHLLRHLINRGTEKFILASSIAAVGMQSTLFRPLQLPMEDEHPCLDRDGYGFSKYMMEEITRYLSRQSDGLDFINLRLCSILPEDGQRAPIESGPAPAWGFGSISVMYLSDVIRCLTLAVEANHRAGVRIMNIMGAQTCVADTVPELMRAWYGTDADASDMSHYERPGHERDPVYDITLVREELGFVPARSILPGG